MFKTEGFFSTDDIFFLRTFSIFFFSLSEIVRSLALFCDITKQVPSPVNQGCYPSLSGFLNSSGHLQKWYIYPDSQTHKELSDSLCAHSLLVMKSGSPTRCLAVILYATFSPLRHLQIPPRSSTHAYFFILWFPVTFIPFHTWFIYLNQCEKSFLVCLCQ